MTMFIVAIAVFVGLHLGVAGSPLRSEIVKAVGEGPYRGLFSLASAAALVWLIWAYGQARGAPANQALWAPPFWAPRATQTLVLLAFLLGVTGLFTPNPTAVGFEAKLKEAEPARGVTRITRHPFLWGVALWAAGHLIANADLAGVLLFAGLGAVALAGIVSIDMKRAKRDPEGWARFKAATSSIPFAAILQRRNTLKLGEIGWRPLAALAIFALVFWAHPMLFGVSPMGVTAP